MSGASPAPGVSVPHPAPTWLPDAVASAGARLVPPGPGTDALLWFGGELDDLRAALASAPGCRWVQLPSAGVDSYVDGGLLEAPGVTWTSAKGAFSRPVAEHALALTLATLRHLPERARARSWGEPTGTSLFGARVLVLGAGGIARTFLDLLAPFGTRNVVVRRRAEPVPGAERTVTTEHLHDELSRADVVVVAAALTTQTRALVGAPELSVMKPGAALVNIARGGLVDTDALVAALTSGRLGGAALDVTDPEPLPDGHPLWDLPTALVTPHTADTREMIEPLLRARIEENLRRFVAGQTLVGVVDPVAGY
ncbi:MULTISPECIES: D-isomer specific 2-hydroxyacid dehydrogenase family protein [Cellulosimicrobium]|uniref:D-isomer specific 2-hydroxyacid dehydrogenase family protein n=1 Tax=Cellulosimicrobium TaxID=157920 RepID=UPI000A324126|nr:D-isomer specific 2-hydroxyacid dehydrogenase family protein [Cellulosimicrobium sp. KWT-B]